MGRGNRDRASSAQGLLYGPRKRGSGPTNHDSFTQFSREFAAGRLPRLFKARLFNNQEGRYHLGSYHYAKVDGISHEPVTMLVFDNDQDQRIMLSYISHDNDTTVPPNPGNSSERDFLHHLAAALPDQEIPVEFTFENPGQWRLFADTYGVDGLEFSGVLAYDGQLSQSEIIDDLARRGDLDDEERAIFSEFTSLAEAYDNPTGCYVLDRLADSRDLCVRWPLSALRDL